MITLNLGKDVFVVGAVKPKRSFPLQARLWPIVLEAAGLLAKLSAVSDGPKPGEPEEPAEASDPVVLEGGEAAAAMLQKPWARVSRLFQQDVDKVLPHIMGAFASVGYDDLAFFQRELLSETTANGHRLFADKPGGIDVFDTVLISRSLDTWRLMWAAIKESYPDFLSPLLGLLGREGEATPSAK